MTRWRPPLAVVLTALLLLAVVGCGSSTRTVTRTDRIVAGIRIGGKNVGRAHRVGPPRAPLGTESLGASPCGPADPERRVQTMDLNSDVPSPRCLRVPPRDRLLFVNATGGPYQRHQGVVRVRVGNWRVRLGPHQFALIPAPVGSYLGRGFHRLGASGAPAPSILVLPEGCALVRPEPGKALCFGKNFLARRRRYSRSDQTPARYRSGAPECQAQRAPGTVGEIGEDIVGSRIADVVACFGPPARRRATPTGQCLFYRQGGEVTYWRLCARAGQIVSALGDVARPG